MKLGVIVGHTQNSQGAYSLTLQAYEYTWNSDLAEHIENTATHLTIRTFFRDNSGIAGAYQASDAFGSDITVELHFNSSHNTSSKGTGVLYYPGSTRGRSFATLLFEEMDAVLGVGDWPRGSGGVVTPFQASGQQRRGETSLKSGRAPAALIEPFLVRTRPNAPAQMPTRQTSPAPSCRRQRNTQTNDPNQNVNTSRSVTTMLSGWSVGSSGRSSASCAA